MGQRARELRAGRVTALQGAAPVDEAQLRRDRIAQEMMAERLQIQGESGAFAAGAGEGISFGGSNWAERKIRSLLFDQSEEETRTRQETRREDYPMATLGGNVLGAIRTGGMLPITAATKAGRALRAAEIGAAENLGIQTGRGEVETPKDILRETAKGGGGGLAGQSLLDVAAPAVKQLYGYIAPSVGAPGGKAVAKSIGQSNAEDVFLGPSTPGGSNLASNLDLTEGRTIMNLAEELSPNQVLGDAPGLETKLGSLISDPATSGTTAPIRETITSRIANADRDAEMLIMDSFGKAPSKVDTAAIYTAKKAAFGDIYSEVFDRSVKSGQSFSVERTLDTIRSVREGSIVKGAISVLDSLEKYIKGGDILGANGLIDARSLLNLKKTIDAEIKENVIKGSDKATRLLLLDANKAVKQMLDEVDGYSAAARNFADTASEENAGVLGAEMFKLNKFSADEISDVYGKLVGPEKRAFRAGMLDQLKEAALTSTDSSYIKRHFGRGPTKSRAKMEVVFGKDQVDSAVEATDNYITNITNAENWLSSLGARPVKGGEDQSLLAAMNLGAATPTAVQPAGMRSGTEFGLVRNLMNTLQAPARAETRAVTGVLQQGKEEALQTLMNMIQSRAGRLGPRAAVLGAPGGVVGGELSNLMSGR